MAVRGEKMIVINTHPLCIIHIHKVTLWKNSYTVVVISKRIAKTAFSVSCLAQEMLPFVLGSYKSKEVIWFYSSLSISVLLLTYSICFPWFLKQVFSSVVNCAINNYCRTISSVGLEAQRFQEFHLLCWMLIHHCKHFLYGVWKLSFKFLASFSLQSILAQY